MKFKRKVLLEKGHLDIAPLIDVVFLLLIFFMLTSSFIFQSGIRINLPKAVTSEVLAKDLLVLVVTDDNKVYVNERPVGHEEVSSLLRVAARDGRPLLIKADKGAALGTVIEVWDLCRQYEMKQVNIATTQ